MEKGEYTGKYEKTIKCTALRYSPYNFKDWKNLRVPVLVINQSGARIQYFTSLKQRPVIAKESENDIFRKVYGKVFGTEKLVLH